MKLNIVLFFLCALEKNNNREWMTANKTQYSVAKKAVIELVQEILNRSDEFDPSLEDQEAQKALFRINRDIRFSKNKDPYKTNFGMVIANGGRKSGNPCYYIHLSPEKSFIGGGIYQPNPKILKKVRQEIDYNGDAFVRVTEEKKFKEFYGEPMRDDALKTAPKGYPKDHPHLRLLQLKHYFFSHNLSDTALKSEQVVDHIVKGFLILNPFNRLLSEAIEVLKK